jgi:HK97 family phage prohead protease
MVDREGHLITTDALTKAFDKYMDNFRTRNVMVMHSDVQVGHALPAYITKGGSVFRSGVDPRGLFFITELRNDTRIAAKVKEQIESGKMRSYSIAGNATESKDIHKEDGTKIMQVNNLELAEVTICEKGVNQGAHFDLMKGMLLDKEERSTPPVRSNDLLLEETLSKGIFGKKKLPDLSDPKLHEAMKTESANLDAQQAKDTAQRQKVSDVLRTHLSSPTEQRPMSQGMQSAMADIQARKKANEANQPGIEASLKKSAPLLGMFQDFMGKEKKHSTDTPLGNQTVHPDHKGEEERRKQLARVQEEFGLPEETAGAEYNRYAPVDYKNPHSFTSARVVNQSGQDLASPQIGHESLIHSTEKIKSLQKAVGESNGFNGHRNRKPSPGEEKDPRVTYEEYSPRQTDMQQAGRKGELTDRIMDTYGSAETFQNGSKDKGIQHSIDKVLSKLFQKAGKDKEDRTPGNSPTPNEFPADSSPSPYESKGLFEKAGDDMRQDGITNHPPRRSPLTKPEDDRSYTPGHFEKQHGDTADIDRSTIRQRAAREAMRGAADIPPEDPEFEYESSYGPHDDSIDTDEQAYYKWREAKEKQAEQGGKWGSRGQAPSPATRSRTPLDRPAATRTGTTSRGVRQAGGEGRKAGWDRSQRKVYGVKGRTQRPTRYKDIDRTSATSFDDSAATPKQETDYAPPALKNSMQKQVRSPQGTDVRRAGMPQQRGQQGPTTAWGDPKRTAVPTMRQQMPWDETKSMEKNSDEAPVRSGMASYLGGKKSMEKGPPSLGPPRSPEPHDAAGAAASRKRVAAGKGESYPSPHTKRTRDLATEAVNREAKRRERGDPGFPKRASLLKTTDSSDDDVHRSDLPPLHGFGSDKTSQRRIDALVAGEQRQTARQRESDTTGLPLPEDLPTEKDRQRRRFRSAQGLIAYDKQKPSDPRGGGFHQIAQRGHRAELERLRNIKPESFDDPDPPHITNSLNKEHKAKKGKAILAVPYNLATQRIMGKDAPAAVSADDRLKQAVLILLKQQQTAEEVGRDVLATGGIKVGSKDAPAGQGAIEGAAAGKGGGLVGRKTYGAATSAAKLPGRAAGLIGGAAKKIGSSMTPPKQVGVRGVETKFSPDTSKPEITPQVGVRGTETKFTPDST